MNLKKILIILLALNIVIAPLKSSNKCSEALISTAMGFLAISTFASGTCAFYVNPDHVTQNSICKGAFVLSGIALVLLISGICCYCKRQQKIKEKRAAALLRQQIY